MSKITSVIKRGHYSCSDIGYERIETDQTGTKRGNVLLFVFFLRILTKFNYRRCKVIHYQYCAMSVTTRCEVVYIVDSCKIHYSSV